MYKHCWQECCCPFKLKTTFLPLGLVLFFRLLWRYAARLSYICTSNDYIKCNDTHCISAEHRAAIADHYNQTVCALQSADNGTVPKIPCNSLRPFWNDELNELKSQSFFGMLCGVIMVHHHMVVCVRLRIPVSLNTNLLLNKLLKNMNIQYAYQWNERTFLK